MSNHFFIVQCIDNLLKTLANDIAHLFKEQNQ